MNEQTDKPRPTTAGATNTAFCRPNRGRALISDLQQIDFD